MLGDEVPHELRRIAREFRNEARQLIKAAEQYEQRAARLENNTIDMFEEVHHGK